MCGEGDSELERTKRSLAWGERYHTSGPYENVKKGEVIGRRARSEIGGPPRRGLNPMRRRALELLASRPSGVIKKLLMLGHGFDGDMIAGLVRTGLATAERETTKTGGKMIENVRIRITDAGRSAIAD